MQVEFVINRQPVALEVDPRETLLGVLRERLELRGTKYGCGEGECGACTVILNGRPVNACLIPMGQVHGAEVLTVEAMTADAVGQHVVDAFVECGAVQCGFCTPGLVLSSRALLVENPTPTDAEVKDALAGNLCRCTGYAKIVQAVHTAATRISDGPPGRTRAKLSHPGSRLESMCDLEPCKMRWNCWLAPRTGGWSAEAPTWGSNTRTTSGNIAGST